MYPLARPVSCRALLRPGVLCAARGPPCRIAVYTHQTHASNRPSRTRPGAVAVTRQSHRSTLSFIGSDYLHHEPSSFVPTHGGKDRRLRYHLPRER
jgi:hypothetical protein